MGTDRPILVVEDEDAIATGLRRALTAEGYAVTVARDAREARAALDPAPSLVLLDLGLPDGDGIDLCRVIRTRAPLTPVLILTARHDEIDVVVGLDAGAVDYITKPFRLAELLARLRAHLRDQSELSGMLVEAHGVRIDLAARRVWVEERETGLRNKEFDLLVNLASRAGQVVTREELMSEVWDEHWHGSTKTLDVHISSLRRRIATPAEPSRITTLRGVGYRFEL